MSNVKSSPEAIDARLVRKLADILRETELTEIEIEQGSLKIRVARNLTAAPATVAHVAAPSYASPPLAAVTAAVEVPASNLPAGEQVKSPMVGTVYLSPQPGADAFIKVGDAVKAGQTLLIIEAMKTMNPIPSPRDGKVVAILVSDAQPVEFGEPLIVLA